MGRGKALNVNYSESVLFHEQLVVRRSGWEEGQKEVQGRNVKKKPTK